MQRPLLTTMPPLLRQRLEHSYHKESISTRRWTLANHLEQLYLIFTWPRRPIEVSVDSLPPRLVILRTHFCTFLDLPDLYAFIGHVWKYAVIPSGRS